MPDARIIEVEGEDAGIVVGDEHGFQFFAAIRAYGPLDGTRFRSSAEAQKAVSRFASDRGLCRSRVPSAFLDRRTSCR
jgi:hypothetical protein